MLSLEIKSNCEDRLDRLFYFTYWRCTDKLKLQALESRPGYTYVSVDLKQNGKLVWPFLDTNEGAKRNLHLEFITVFDLIEARAVPIETVNGMPFKEAFRGEGRGRAWEVLNLRCTPLDEPKGVLFQPITKKSIWVRVREALSKSRL